MNQRCRRSLIREMVHHSNTTIQTPAGRDVHPVLLLSSLTGTQKGKMNERKTGPPSGRSYKKGKTRWWTLLQVSFSAEDRRKTTLEEKQPLVELAIIFMLFLFRRLWRLPAFSTPLPVKRFPRSKKQQDGLSRYPFFLSYCWNLPILHNPVLLFELNWLSSDCPLNIPQPDESHPHTKTQRGIRKSIAHRAQQNAVMLA